jgi:hypothetical protein
MKTYCDCPLRKNRARISIGVCEKEKCLYLESNFGKLGCGYSMENYRPASRKGRPLRGPEAGGAKA